ncbi:MAG TPA: hypothetical protein VN442_25795 [Bryobacteraceae bacterium]|nr:hypothetical protein [Bryobacteraceae bacterium]
MLNCSICTHKGREAIEKALVECVPLRAIAGRHRVSKSALDRHKGHLKQELVKANEDAQTARVDSVLGHINTQIAKLTTYRDEAEAVLKGATDAPELKLKAIRELANLAREARAGWEFVAEITGELSRAQNAPQQSNIAVIVLPTSSLPGGLPAALPAAPRMLGAGEVVFTPLRGGQ